MDGGKSDFSCDMVIAIYKEKLDWLKLYDRHDYNFRNIFLYNKFEGNNGKTSQDLHCVALGKECVKINLKNEGRCDHTFLYHIIHHYDTLADVTYLRRGRRIFLENGRNWDSLRRKSSRRRRRCSVLIIGLCR